jgi:hypothetical protein
MRCQNPEEKHHHPHSRENLKSHTMQMFDECAVTGVHFKVYFINLGIIRTLNQSSEVTKQPVCSLYARSETSISAEIIFLVALSTVVTGAQVVQANAGTASSSKSQSSPPHSHTHNH